MRANRESGEHGTENASSCSGPNGEEIASIVDEIVDAAVAEVMDRLEEQAHRPWYTAREERDPATRDAPRKK